MQQPTTNRSNLLVKNIMASFVVKGWSAVVSLLAVPLTLKMLGQYSNGVWLTISGILLWIDMFDIGLGNGLRNIVANYVAKGDTDSVREAVSSTLAMLVVIVLPLLLVLYSVIFFFDMHSALGVEQAIIPELDTVLTVSVTFACGTFVLKSVGNFYMGMQLPAVNNLIICIGQTLALGLTALAYFLGSRSLLMVAVIYTLSPLVVWLLSMPYTFVVRYPQYRPSLRKINMKMSLSLCSKGVQFFILQICSVILFTTTNIIISKMFSPAEVTPYQVAYRYFSLVLVVFNIISMPFWNAATDAYTRGDSQWIRRQGIKLNMVIGGAAVVLAVMVALSTPVYRLWVGSEVVIPLHLSASMALYILILIVSLRYSYILNGLNVLRIQLVFTIAATVLFLPLAWAVCRYFGTVTGLVLVMCGVNLPGMVANRWKYNKIFNSR